MKIKRQAVSVLFVASPSRNTITRISASSSFFDKQASLQRVHRCTLRRSFLLSHSSHLTSHFLQTQLPAGTTNENKTLVYTNLSTTTSTKRDNLSSSTRRSQRTTTTTTNNNNMTNSNSDDNKLTSIISPSLLSCDLANLSQDANDMLIKGADWLHLDVMDGHFVPNLSFGAPVIKCLHKAHPNAFLDVHLMVTDPMSYVKPMADAGASQFTFHIEANMPDGGVKTLIDAIREAGMKVGITLKPGTSVQDILPYGDMVDMFLVMTVEPGFSGQSFMPDMMSKVKELRTAYPTKNISVDGGLSPKTVDDATAAGANVIVSASAIFGSNDRASVIQALRQSVDDALAKA